MEEDKNPPAAPVNPTLQSALTHLLSPVPLIAIIMIVGVMFLLMMAIFGWDRGHVLLTMAQPDFARGLITYLFTIVTIGTAIVLIISGLTGGEKERFDRGKEILGLLLGVFGTMVGFYFGSEVSRPHTKLTVSSPLLSAGEVVSGQAISVTAIVQGGALPYRLGIAVSDNPPTTYDQAPRGDGWIVSSLNGPDVPTDTPATLWISVMDGNGDVATAKSTFIERPKPKQ